MVSTPLCKDNSKSNVATLNIYNTVNEYHLNKMKYWNITSIKKLKLKKKKMAG